MFTLLHVSYHLYLQTSTLWLIGWSLSVWMCFTRWQVRISCHLYVYLSNLITLPDVAGDPAVPVTILDNMGRCGSTMVCKVLSQIPGLRVMCEPWALLNLQYLFMKGNFDLETYSRLISAVIKIQVSPFLIAFTL